MSDIQPQGYCQSSSRVPSDLATWGDGIDAVLTELLGGGAESSATLTGNAFTPANAAGPVYSLTPSSGATDTLNTITATNCRDGHVIGIRPASGKTITIGSAGNIATCDGSAPALSSASQFMFFKYKALSSKWEEIGASANVRGFPAFTSPSDQSFSAGGNLSVAHGLTYTPRMIWGAFVCQIANAGYSPGDVVTFFPASIGQDGGPRSIGVSMWADGTNVNAVVGANGVELLNKSTGGVTILTAADWLIRIYAN